MSRKKLEEREIRKLTRVGRGNSVSITLPIEFIRELKWKSKQKVTVKKVGSRLIIEDWKK